MSFVFESFENIKSVFICVHLSNIRFWLRFAALFIDEYYSNPQ
jgi:hypothetical protein